MTFPDWSTIAAAVIAFLTGATWIGRQQQRMNGHGIAISENKEAWKVLDRKMDAHIKASTEQWVKVQRSLGRIEGTIGSRNT